MNDELAASRDVNHPHIAQYRARVVSSGPILTIHIEGDTQPRSADPPPTMPEDLALDLTLLPSAVDTGSVRLIGGAAMFVDESLDPNSPSIDQWLELVLLPELTLTLDEARMSALREPTSLVYQRLRERATGTQSANVSDDKVRRRGALGEALSHGRTSISVVDYLPDGELWRPRVARGRRITEVSAAHPYAKAVSVGLDQGAPGYELAAELLAALAAAEQDALNDANRDAYEMLRRRVSRVLARAPRGADR